MKIVSVPFNGGSLKKNIGCEKAPKLILEDEESHVLDVDNYNIIKTNEILENADGDIFIGGDHSITYSLFKGFLKNKNKKKTGLIIFDAHPDCVNNFSPPTHEDFLRVLIEENILLPENVFLIGLRKIDKIEEEFLRTKKIKHVLMKNLENKESYLKLIKEIKEFVLRFDSWYLSIDIDILDPKEAPGTGCIEKEGFKLNDFKKIIKEISHVKNLERIDLVEVNPDKDIDNKTVNCAKGILEIQKLTKT